MSGPAGAGGRPISELIADIVDNIRHMLRGELRLAARDLSREATRFRSAALLCTVGAGLGALACVAFLAAAIAALSLVLPPWAAALTVGGLVALAGGLVIAAGIGRMRRVQLPPERTAERVKENIQWVKHHSR